MAKEVIIEGSIAELKRNVARHRNFMEDVYCRDGFTAEGSSALTMVSRTAYDASCQAKMLADLITLSFESRIDEPVGKSRSDLLFGVVATLGSMAEDLRAIRNAIEMLDTELVTSTKRRV